MNKRQKEIAENWPKIRCHKCKSILHYDEGKKERFITCSHCHTEVMTPYGKAANEELQARVKKKWEELHANDRTGQDNTRP